MTRGLLLLLASSLACAGVLPQRPVQEPVFVDVGVAMPGASPDAVEAEIAQPIEAALRTVPALASTRTRSSDGVAEIRLRFPAGTDPWEARAQVLEALRGVQLPNSAEAPVLLSRRDHRVATVVLRGDSPSQVSGVARVFRDGVIRIPGVLDAVVIGLVEEQLHVRLDAVRLQAVDITPSDVAAALSNVQSSALGAGARGPLDLGAASDLLLRPGVRLSDVATLSLEQAGVEGRVTGVGVGDNTLVEIFGTAPKGTREQQALFDAVAALVSATPGASLRSPDAPVGAEEAAYGGEPTEQTVVAVISGPDRDALRVVRDALALTLGALPGVAAVAAQSPAAAPELSVQVDRERMAAVGLRASDVAEGLRLLDPDGLPSAEGVRVTVDGLGSLEDPASASLLVRTDHGLERIPVSAVAEVTLGLQWPRLDRVDSQRAELLTIELSEGTPRAELDAALSAVALPTGVAVALHSCPACP